VLPVIVDTTGVDENGISIKKFLGNVNLLLQFIDGQHDILKDLFRECHRSYSWGGCKLEKGRLWGEEPAEKPSKDWLISKWNHGLDDPENGSVVTKEVIPHWYVLFSFPRS